MEIKKADSKGRVTGFEPGRYYFFTKRDSASVLLTPSPLHDAVAEDLDWLNDEQSPLDFWMDALKAVHESDGLFPELFGDQK